MDDRDGLSALIDRIVRDAAITSARGRAELRRELESHFADARDSPEALQAAMNRFGDPALVSAELGEAHHRSRFSVHLLRLGLAILASAMAALVFSSSRTFASEAMPVDSDSGRASPAPWPSRG
jgi:hypothetical protein